MTGFSLSIDYPVGSGFVGSQGEVAVIGDDRGIDENTTPCLKGEVAAISGGVEGNNATVDGNVSVCLQGDSCASAGYLGNQPWVDGDILSGEITVGEGVGIGDADIDPSSIRVGTGAGDEIVAVG